MNWKQRLKQARTSNDLYRKKVAFAKAMGVSSATVTDWEKAVEDGGIQELKSHNLIKACALLDIKPNYLLTGEQATSRVQDYQTPDRTSERAESRIRQEHLLYSFDKNVSESSRAVIGIPVISPVQAGRFTLIETPYPLGAGFDIEYVNAEDHYSRWTFALEILGKSMEPLFQEGDRVIIDPEITANAGDFVVARNGREEATFKKYRPRGMGENGHMIFELTPLNSDFASMRSDVEQLEIIGVLVEHRKKYRRAK